ncbi:MAG: TonB-dependent receptor [Candidatus Aminicenantales bacterium]
MKKKDFFILFFFLISVFNLIAEEAPSIEGKIIDKETKDPLPAYVTVVGTEIGCTADIDGHFKLNLKSFGYSQKIKILAWLIGYKKKEVEAKIGEYLTIELEIEPLSPKEIVVTADSIVSEEKSKKTVTMNKMDIYTLPGAAADPVYASHILPGVNSMPDASNILIRGGAPDEVAYFLDGIELEHPFLTESLHESYFSIFDNQIIEDFSVSTSGFPAKFGDALSGIMNISAKDNIFKGEGGLGISILGLSCYAGLPIKNDQCVVGSYNRGYSYLLTRINNREESEYETENAFGKANLRLNKFHTIRLLGLFDKYRFSHESGFNTNSRNTIAGFSLTSTLANNLVTKLSLSHINYRAFYQVEGSFQKDIKDVILQARLDTSLALGRHFIEFGADIQNRKIDVSVGLLNIDSDFYETQKGTRLGLYFDDKFRVLNNLFINLGVRLSSLDLNDYKLNFDPRFSVAYLITKNDILRFSMGEYHQFGDYFTLKENIGLGAEFAYHYSLSYDRISEDTNIRFSLYNKEYKNLFLNKEQGIVCNEGYGYARGLEFFIKRKKRSYDLIFVYNFLSSKRKEDDIKSLVRSPYEIDHSFTGIFTLKIKNYSLGIRYSYASGLPSTPLVDREWDNDNQIYLPVWGEPYSNRLPSYQRVDLNGSMIINFQKRLIVLYFGITNVLNRENILRYEYNDDYSMRTNINSIFGRSIFVGIYIPFF